MRGHDQNSIPIRKLNEEFPVDMADNEPVISVKVFDPLPYLKQLLNESADIEQLYFIEDNLADLNDLELDDQFISPKFKINNLKQYFDEISWLLVLNCFEKKQALSTCPDCNC